MPRHRLDELPEELLVRGRLRGIMHLANMRVKFLINHHGWIHILIAFQMLLAILPILQVGRMVLNAVYVVLIKLALLIHDWGLVRDRDHHSRYSSEMTVELEEDYRDWGLTGRWHEVVRLLVRFHRDEDTMLIFRLKPKARYVLSLLEADVPMREILDIPEIKELIANKKSDGQPEEGHDDYFKVFRNLPPTDHEFKRYLQLWLGEGVPMLELQALLSICDTGDFGAHRVRGYSRRVIERYLHKAKARRGKTLYHLLKRLKIRIDTYEVSGYSVRETWIEIRTASGEVIQKILIQNARGEGLFKIAQDIDEGRLDVRSILTNVSQWVTTHRKAKCMRPAQIVLRYRQDPRVCSNALVERRFGKYLRTFTAAVAIWGLEGIVEWEEISSPPTRLAS